MPQLVPTQAEFDALEARVAALEGSSPPPPTDVPPVGSDVVILAGQVRTVTADWNVNTVTVQGQLVFDPQPAAITLRCRTLDVQPTGELVMVQTDPTKTRILLIADVPLDPADTEQMGNGLIVMGKVRIQGASKTPFIRLASPALAGQTTLMLSTPVTSWRASDKLVLPDSKQWETSGSGSGYASQWEEGVIASVAADGLSVTLTAPLQYDHPGHTNPDGELEFLPHVANRTRNVVVKSENASGVRGHAVFMSRADVEIRYATFSSLGRTTLDPTGPTNHGGRYPVHFHHLYGPASVPAGNPQFTFVGNVVSCGLPTHRFKWGLTIHDSHYGLIQDNVILNWAGSGLITTSGNETGNVIEGNFVARGRGESDRDAKGREGCAFWFAGPNNRVRNNVAANWVAQVIETAYGFKYYQKYTGDVAIPNFPGANTTSPGEFTVVPVTDLPILECVGNEAYGVENGLSYWWINSYGSSPGSGGPSVIEGFTVWNHYLYGVYGYDCYQLTLDSLVVCSGWPAIGLYIGDYFHKNFVLQNAGLRGLRFGILHPTTNTGDSTFTIKDSYFQCSTGIRIGDLYTSGYRSDLIPPRTIEIRGVMFEAMPGQAPIYIAMTHEGYDVANLVQRNEVFVYDHQQNAGDDFQVYYAEQAASWVLPQTIFNADGTPRLKGSPVAGLTNRQNWDQHGVAFAGAVAPVDAAAVFWVMGLVRSLP